MIATAQFAQLAEATALSMLKEMNVPDELDEYAIDYSLTYSFESSNDEDNDHDSWAHLELA